VSFLNVVGDLEKDPRVIILHVILQKLNEPPLPIII
jgi:hypothetical protein